MSDRFPCSVSVFSTPCSHVSVCVVHGCFRDTAGRSPENSEFHPDRCLLQASHFQHQNTRHALVSATLGSTGPPELGRTARVSSIHPKRVSTQLCGTVRFPAVTLLVTLARQTHGILE